MSVSVVVGQKVGPLQKGPITHVDLVKYAGASGDFNPIHTVEHYAVGAGLGGVIAHGMLTMAYVGQLMTDFAGLDADLIEFGVRFRAMVRPGDIIVCHGTVSGIREDHDGDRVMVQVVAQNQADEVVVKGHATLRYIPKGDAES